MFMLACWHGTCHRLVDPCMPETDFVALQYQSAIAGVHVYIIIEFPNFKRIKHVLCMLWYSYAKKAPVELKWSMLSSELQKSSL